jgi:hypothetical protein
MSVIQYNKGIDGFFNTVFSFLRRKTDLMTQPTEAKDLGSQYLEEHESIYKEEK